MELKQITVRDQKVTVDTTPLGGNERTVGSSHSESNGLHVSVESGRGNNSLRAAVPFGGQTGQFLINLSPKRERSPKRVQGAVREPRQE